MRETKGTLNGGEFIKLKPDLLECGIKGIVTAEVIDSATGEIVQSCKSENVITNAFYRNAVAFMAEDFVNGARHSGYGNTAYLGSPSYGGSRSMAFGILTLALTDAPENENIRYLNGEIAGTAVVSNNVSRAERWAGNLRNPQEMPTIGTDGSVRFTRKFEFSEPKIVGRQFNALYWQPDVFGYNDTNVARLISQSYTIYDSMQMSAISGAGYFGDSKYATKLPNVKYPVPLGVSIRYYGTRWHDMPYCYASGYLTATTSTTVIIKYDTNTGAIVEQRQYPNSGGNSYGYYSHGRTYTAFQLNGTHPVSGSGRYILRCNNETGDIEASAINANYPQSANNSIDEDGNFRYSNTVINFASNTFQTFVTTTDLDIPQWLYNDGVRPTVSTFSAGVDGFDVVLYETYFGTVYASYVYDDLTFKNLSINGYKYRGILLYGADATASQKNVPAPPTVMYKFPTTISKTESQILIITYELAIPAEIMDVTKNYIW